MIAVFAKSQLALRSFFIVGRLAVPQAPRLFRFLSARLKLSFPGKTASFFVKDARFL